MTDKVAVLVGIRTFRAEILKELDRLEDVVMSLADSVSEETTPAIDNDDWMTAKRVCEELNISDSTFYTWINAGLLPEGVAFGPRSKRWKMSDIQAWRKSKNHDAEKQPKSTIRRRGRPSKIRKKEDFIYA